MTNPLRVALVTPGFPRAEDDTSCIPPLQIVLERLKLSHPEIDIEVVALHYPPGRRRYRWRGIEVRSAGGDNRPLPLRAPAMVRAWAALRSRHTQAPFDLVHALWLNDATLFGWWAARGLGLPLVATVMGQDARPTNRWLRLLPLGSARITAVSARASDELERSLGRGADAVIPWGLDPIGGDPPGWDERTVDLLGVGALTDNKDYAALVEIAARLEATGRSCRVTIIGDGPRRIELERLAARRGLAGRLRFEGHLTREAVLDRMRTARILVHPARYEAFGFVCLEALASGMTVVSRPVGAARASDRWRLGETVEELAAACAAVLDGPQGTEPLTLFTEDEAAAGWAGLYRSLVSEG
ncbi:MAG: glycosyltransferase [Candidatus Sulfomarinibacteraceae bacterium]